MPTVVSLKQTNVLLLGAENSAIKLQKDDY